MINQSNLHARGQPIWAQVIVGNLPHMYKTLHTNMKCRKHRLAVLQNYQNLFPKLCQPNTRPMWCTRWAVDRCRDGFVVLLLQGCVLAYIVYVFPISCCHWIPLLCCTVVEHLLQFQCKAFFRLRTCLARSKCGIAWAHLCPGPCTRESICSALPLTRRIGTCLAPPLGTHVDHCGQHCPKQLLIGFPAAAIPLRKGAHSAIDRGYGGCLVDIASCLPSVSPLFETQSPKNTRVLH